MNNVLQEKIEERLIDIEVRITYNEDGLHSLQETVFQQQLEIQKLHVEIRMLMSRLQEMKGALNDAVEDDPPPHY